MSRTSRLFWALCLAGVTFIAAGDALRIDRVAAAPQAATGAAVPAAQAAPRPFFDQYCITCHNDRLKTGELSLQGVDPAKVSGHEQLLEKVVRKLRTGQMPPEGRPRPDVATIDAFASSVEAALDRAASHAVNPGRVTSRRLNRAEYVNVIHDLLALDVDGTQLLPSDMAGFGFDNNADVLSITPALMARYITAATKISRLAVASPDNRPITQAYKMEFGIRQDARMGEELPFATRGGLAVRHAFPLDGEYVFAIRLRKNGTVSTIDGIEEDEHQIELRIDHALAKQFKIGGKFKGRNPGVLIAVPEEDLEGRKIHDYRMSADKELEVRLPVSAGTRLVSFAFTDTLPSPSLTGRRGGFLGLGMDNQPGFDTVYISGPMNGKTPEDTPSRRQIFSCRPANARDEDACARKIMTALARRAYRRPVTDADVQPLLAIYAQGRKERNFDFGIERSVEALLSSPKFLLRVERDPAAAKPGSVYTLSDLELASRLSFYLWKSMPDDELIDLAARGALKDPAIVRRQVNRMLADSRSKRFLSDFVEQWLTVRNIHSQDPDQLLFAGFDPTLRQAMAEETELFFESQVRDDRPVPELLNANYTFLNERLARHYGINDVYGSHFRRVTLTDDRRFGLLGQASILTVTSYPNRTSVVLRGKWVLENLLGAPPPPPPPNVPPLKENTPGAKPESLRARMEQHRNSPVCASCHSQMDPLGFALEHFDAIGRWRETDGGAEINSTITLDGQTIDSPKAFREALLHKDNLFVDTVAEKMLTYALGRGVDFSDRPFIRQIVRDMSQNQDRWTTLVMGVVNSPPFKMRKVPAANQPAASTAAAQQ